MRAEQTNAMTLKEEKKSSKIKASVQEHRLGIDRQELEFPALSSVRAVILSLLPLYPAAGILRHRASFPARVYTIFNLVTMIPFDPLSSSPARFLPPAPPSLRCDC